MSFTRQVLPGHRRRPPHEPDPGRHRRAPPRSTIEADRPRRGRCRRRAAARARCAACRGSRGSCRSDGRRRARAGRLHARPTTSSSADPATPGDRIHAPVPAVRGRARPAPGTEVRRQLLPAHHRPDRPHRRPAGQRRRARCSRRSRGSSPSSTRSSMLAYDSAFLETATGSSLDRVVALLGYRRYRAGRPVGQRSLRPPRRAVGDVTIPAGTPITDSQDKIRYETIETRTHARGRVDRRGPGPRAPPTPRRSSKAGRAHGDPAGHRRRRHGHQRAARPPPPPPTRPTSSCAHARASALLAASKGTVPAIEHGLLQLPHVRSVTDRGVPERRRRARSRVGRPEGSAPGGALPTRVLAADRGAAAGRRPRRRRAGGHAPDDRRQRRAGAGRQLAGARRPGRAASVGRAPARRRGRRDRRIGQPVRTGRLVAASCSPTSAIVDATLRLGEQGKPPRDARRRPRPRRATAVRGSPDGDVAFAADTLRAGRDAGGAPVSVAGARHVSRRRRRRGRRRPTSRAQIQDRLEALPEAPSTDQRR